MENVKLQQNNNREKNLGNYNEGVESERNRGKEKEIVAQRRRRLLHTHEREREEAGHRHC